MTVRALVPVAAGIDINFFKIYINIIHLDLRSLSGIFLSRCRLNLRIYHFPLLTDKLSGAMSMKWTKMRESKAIIQDIWSDDFSAKDKTVMKSLHSF